MPPDRDWLATVLGDGRAAEVTHAEEHHGVTAADTLSGAVTPTHRATGWEPKDDGREFAGYLVEVTVG